MKIINSTRNKGIIILFIILITISLSSSVFAEPKIIHGLKSADNPDQIAVYCDYNSITNNCTLESQSGVVDYYIIINNANIFVEGVNNPPNFIIDTNVNFAVSCIKNTSEVIIQTIYPNWPQLCVYDDATLNITDFNSIIIRNNHLLSIHWLANSHSKISGEIIIPQEARFFFSLSQDINRCIDVNSQDPNYSAKLTLPVIDFSESQIYNNGSFIFNTSTTIFAATITDDENLCSTGGKNDPNISLEVNKRKLIFGDIYNNSGDMNFWCTTSKNDSSKEDVIIIEPTCDITFNNFSGKLPKRISFYNFSKNYQNYGTVKLSTCDVLDKSGIVDYNGVCKFIYIRDNNSYTNITTRELRIDNNSLVSLVKTCNSSNISDHIAHYLFTSDSNIESRPIVFGTINSARTSQPLDILLNTSGNYGLYNTKNLNQRISTISQTEFTFFKLFLPNNYSTDTNLLDSYLFKFKLDSNSVIGYPDINLNYPFKIHK